MVILGGDEGLEGIVQSLLSGLLVATKICISS